MAAKQPIPEEDKIEVAAFLLGKMIPTRAKAELQKRYKCSRAAAEIYIREARAYIRGLANVTKEEATAQTLSQIEAVVNDPMASPRDRASAIRLKMNLLGLNAPVRFETSLPPLFDPQEERSKLKTHADEALSAVNDRPHDSEGISVSQAPASVRNGTCTVDDRFGLQSPDH